MTKVDLKGTAAAVNVTAAEVPVPANHDLQDTGKSVVVLAWPGTQKDMKKIWDINGPEGSDVRTASGIGLAEMLAEIVADNSVSRDFVLVPANLVPVHPVTFEELAIPTEDVSPAGTVRWGRTPVRFDKDVLAELLPDLSDHASEEELVREYQKRTMTGIPYQVGHDFGNYFTKVLRGNPCRHVIMEGFCRKHFIFSSADGWPAVRELADETILKS